MAQEYLRVGLILRPHGIQGAVRLQPLTDDAARFSSLHEAYLEKKDGYLPVRVHTLHAAQNEVILKVEGTDTRDAAQQLRNLYLCVDRAHAVHPPEGRYFIADLIGCAVSDSAGNALGELIDVLEKPAQDVYVIRLQGERKGTLSVPALKKLLLEVDVEKRRIVLDAQVLEEVGLFED